MEREPRILEPDSLVEVTMVTIQARFSLRPPKEVNVRLRAAQQVDRFVTGASLAQRPWRMIGSRDVTGQATAPSGSGGHQDGD